MGEPKKGGNLYRLKNHEEGVHLAPSHDSAGAYRGILFDDEKNQLVGHAEWEKVDESEIEREYKSEYKYDHSHDDQEDEQRLALEAEEEKRAQLMAQAILAGAAYVLANHVAPTVQNWWENKALPTMKEKWKTFTDKRKDLLPKGK
jgi:hypothetical protein